MKDLLNKHFKNIDLDIKKSKLGTFMDQKVTPDVLSGVSECIIEYLKENQEPFTINDIRYFEYSNTLVKEVFNKPDVEKAENEYDKFFSHQIKMLAYAKVLVEDKNKRPFKYIVNNTDVLEYIALRERNSLNFFEFYITKLLKDSNLFFKYELFFDKQDKSSYEKLRNSHIEFIQKYTPQNDKKHITRIFTKILNPLSYKLKKFGTRKGRISKTVISLDELYYNRPNWRDINKDKSLTREEAKELFDDIVDNKPYFKYQVTKAKKLVKHLHKFSEIHRFKEYPALQAHHIFMDSEYPEIADFPENIIAITPNQHYYRAHPNNKTTVIDENYQLICLLSKLDSIEISKRTGNNDYSLTDFIHILNTGFETENFKSDMEFEELKHQIVKYTYANA